MKVQVTRLQGGPWGQNCFVLHRQSKALIIDPGAATTARIGAILDFLRKNGLILDAIVNTHGHFDHIGGVIPLVDATGADFFISGKEEKIMKQSNMLRYMFKISDGVSIPKRYTDLDGLPRTLERAGLQIVLVPTPGHTPGGYCFIVEDKIFTGDTLLPSTSLPSQLPGSNLDDLFKSIDALRQLPNNMNVYPGHGSPISLGEALEAFDRTNQVTK
jgi:hydroxyacylglutathione hydrolase